MRITDTPRHIHTLCVDFENSTMIEDVFNDVFKEAIVKIYLYFIFYIYI